MFIFEANTVPADGLAPPAGTLMTMFGSYISAGFA